MRAFVCAVAIAAALAQPRAGAEIVYKVTISAPEHHVADVEVTFPGVTGTLHARMSRSSPGRYAVHEFAKNVYDVHAYDGRGRELAVVRATPSEWDVAGHDGTVRITYRIYGDLVDGTYLGIDTSHAHMNMPATFMWARGFDDRPERFTFTPPLGSNWKAATQLYPTSDPWTFTAPNLQYMMDSPTELSAYAQRQFEVRNPDGKTFTIRMAVHSQASDEDLDFYAAGVQKIVREAGAVYGEYPAYEPGGTYTFLADYLPWDGGDGMEHRNSTVVTGRGSIRGALGTASHEFFHCWNVERIRPQGLEPFNFEDANMTDSLWVAEGFTQYYGSLLLARAGIWTPKQAISAFASLANAVVTEPGRQFNSAVGMSHMAPFVDAARSIDPPNFSNTFISYYTYGGAIALGLDLSLRDRTGSKISLDDFMRAMWRKYGKPGGPEPGLVGHPYSLADLHETLAEVAGDRAFADDFFNRYMVGRDAVDYARLMQRAGVVFRTRNPGRAWIGDVHGGPTGTRIGSLTAPGSPAYEAGLDEDDQITAIDGKPVATWSQVQDAIASHKPGDRIRVDYTRRTGAAARAAMTLKQDPSLEAVLVEDIGGTLTAAQKSFRDAWLGSHAH
ncbi:MAG TPA: PDZ domain-containing protein [Vicinamibacterales bacterium]